MLEISFPHPRNIIPHTLEKTNEFWSKKYQRMKKKNLPFDVQFFILKNIQYTVHPCTFILSKKLDNKYTLVLYPLKEIRKLVHPCTYSLKEIR